MNHSRQSAVARRSPLAIAPGLAEGVECAANVVALELEAVEPERLVSAFERWAGALGERERPLGMSRAESIRFTSLVETLERELRDRLEHEEPALARLPQEALVDEGRDAVEICAHPLLCGLEREAPGEDRQPGKERPFSLVEQIVAPLHRRPQRPLALRRVAQTCCQQVEPTPEPLQNLAGGQDLRPRCCEFERERQAVETAADLSDVAIDLKAGVQRLCSRREE